MISKTQEQLFQEDLARKEERIKTRTINEREYTIRCFDPYGHWHIEGTGGKLAKTLEGAFTTELSAWRAIEAYENSRPTPTEKTIVSTDGKGGRKRIPLDSTLS